MATVFDSLKIGNFEVKNRLAVAPTVKNIADQDGRVNHRILTQYGLEADGPGLYIVSMTYTEEQGHVFTGQTGIADWKHVYGMTEVANRIHKAGAKAMLQISHGGNLCVPDIIGETPVGPSSIEQWAGVPVRALTTEEVYKIADNYGKASLRAKNCGFDGVEFHSCHGSLMLQFLSKLQNQGRDDIFANGREFLYECFRKSKEYCGEDFPIGVRISCHEFLQEDLGKEGFTWDECKEIVVELEKMGACYIHASAGRIGHTGDYCFPSLYEPRGVNVHFARKVKELVNIPVITVGRLQDAKLIKQIIERGDADMVAMCRPVICDPHISKKIMDGRDDDIRKCMGCNWCCEKLFIQESLECPLNPAYGWEDEYKLIPTEYSKKVMVIGGGVAGMYAAYAAAARGHKVSLYEKSGALGGQLLLGAAYPSLYTRELLNLPNWLIRQIKKLPVEIHMNTCVDMDLIERENPETIIVATGATEMPTEFKSNDAVKVVSLWDYLAGKAEVGKNVVVYGKEGVEIAASLGNERKNVTLIQDADGIIWPEYVMGGSGRREPLGRMLKKGKVDIKCNAKVTAVTAEGAVIEAGGETCTIPCDTVVYADGRIKDDSLFRAMKGKSRELYVVGDAWDLGSMLTASHQGYWAGRNI